MPNVTDEYKRVHPATRTALRQWFATNAEDSPGVWVVMWKQSSGRKGPSYEDVVEEALCVGWIDSRKISLDDERSAQLVTPRKPRSPWADSNKERVRRLIDERKMRPAGLAAIAEAKRNGTWNATPRIDPTDVPDDLAKALAKNGDLFIQDAFGALHRAHASTAGVTKHLSGAIGFLVQRELEFLDRVIGNPQRPFLAIIGGAKVSDKLAVLDKLLERVDALLIGGAMAYTFLAAQGINIGKSLLEKDQIDAAKAIIEKAYNKKVEILLPADHLVVREIKPDAAAVATQAMAIPSDMIGVDIGPHAIEFFTDHVSKAQTIFWNGPMGIFEMPAFAQGSFAIAKAMAEATEKGAITIVGGGDSLSVLVKTGLAGKMSHCSTGGGASLELLEGKALPGLVALAS